MSLIIPHSQPSLIPGDHRCLREIFQSKMIAQGRYVRQFEETLSAFLGVKDSVALSSGTAALHLALLGLDVGPGDEVIIPSYVCTALLNAVHYAQAQPVIVDVRAEDGNICPAAVQQALTRKTKAVIVPHMFGVPAEVRSIVKLGVPVIEDCAQALGAEYRDKRVGQFGAASIYSFYATKVITTGEGGLLASNNAKLIERARDLRDYDNKPEYCLRYNYKMTDLQARLGLNQMGRLDFLLKKRRALAKQYDQAVFDLPVQRPHIGPDKHPIHYRYLLRTSQKSALIKFLQDKGIHACSPVFKPLHVYASSSECAQATTLMLREVSLPLYPDLTAQQSRHLTQSLKQFFA